MAPILDIFNYDRFDRNFNAMDCPKFNNYFKLGLIFIRINPNN